MALLYACNLCILFLLPSNKRRRLFFGLYQLCKTREIKRKAMTSDVCSVSYLKAVWETADKCHVVNIHALFRTQPHTIIKSCTHLHEIIDALLHAYTHTHMHA